MSEVFDAFRAEVGLPSLDELLARPAWHADALCKEYPRAWFFPERGDDVSRAVAVCRRCLVHDECLAYALELGADAVGVWGGTTTRSRHKARWGRGVRRNDASGKRAEAVELSRQGVSVVGIAARLGVSPRSVYGYLADAVA